MNSYKKDFLDFLFETQALKIDSEYRLKNKRLSPYFVNIGEFNHGVALKKLGDAYAAQIASYLDSTGQNVELLFGPSYKGVPIVVATSMSLAEKGRDIGIAFNRKEAKTHGEIGDNKNSQKSIIVGREIRDNDRIIILDDVLTTAETKYEMIDFLKNLASSVTILAIIIAVDRQEVGIDGKNAVEEITAITGIPVIPVINSYDLFSYLQSRNDIDARTLNKISMYMRVYGTQTLKKQLGTTRMQTIIQTPNSIIPACDIPTKEEYEELIKQTHDIDKIGGYKLGFELALQYGLPELVAIARKYTNKPLIYDHQKAATDIPDKGKEFARVCKNSGIDTVILFPQAGPETERAWIYHAMEQGLNVIVGGVMTHKAYRVSEGGFISDTGAMEIYRIAARAGVNNFVVPGTKLELITSIKEIIESEGISPTFYSPGFFTQGGDVAAIKNLLGERIHVIVGREINSAVDKKQVVLDIIQKF